MLCTENACPLQSNAGEVAGTPSAPHSVQVKGQWVNGAEGTG